MLVTTTMKNMYAKEIYSAVLVSPSAEKIPVWLIFLHYLTRGVL